MKTETNKLLACCAATLLPALASAQDTSNWISSPGIIGTIVLIVLVLFVAVFIITMRASKFLKESERTHLRKQKLEFSEDLINMEEGELDEILERRKKALKHQLKGTELGGELKGSDDKGLISKLSSKPGNPIVDEKKSRP